MIDNIKNDLIKINFILDRLCLQIEKPNKLFDVINEKFKKFKVEYESIINQRKIMISEIIELVQHTCPNCVGVVCLCQTDWYYDRLINKQFFNFIDQQQKLSKEETFLLKELKFWHNWHVGDKIETYDININLRDEFMEGEFSNEPIYDWNLENWKKVENAFNIIKKYAPEYESSLLEKKLNTIKGL